MLVSRRVVAWGLLAVVRQERVVYLLDLAAGVQEGRNPSALSSARPGRGRSGALHACTLKREKLCTEQGHVFRFVSECHDAGGGLRVVRRSLALFCLHVWRMAWLFPSASSGSGKAEFVCPGSVSG